MSSTHRFRLALLRSKKLIYATFLATIGSLLVPLLPANAQALPPLPIQFNPETLRSPGRPGGRQRGGGSRGICGANSVPLSAIAYADRQSSQALGVEVVEESVGSFTTQAQPLLWFYMPRAISDSSSAELIVQNERSEVVYRGQLKGTTEDNGIIRVPMAIEIESGTAYRWTLSLDCGDTASESVSGWVVRQEAQPKVSRLFNQAEPRNRVALYANYGYLQDALSELAMLRLANLSDEEIAENWVGFLIGLGLEDLTAAPILDCCELAGIETEEIEQAVDEIEAPEAGVENEPVEATEPVEVAEPTEPTRSEARESIIRRVRRRSPLNR